MADKWDEMQNASIGRVDPSQASSGDSSGKSTGESSDKGGLKNKAKSKLKDKAKSVGDDVKDSLDTTKGSNETSDSEPPKQEPSKLKKAAAKAGSQMAAHVGIRALIAAKIAQFMQQLMMMLALLFRGTIGLIAGALHAIAGFFISIGHGLVVGVTAIAGAIGGLFSIGAVASLAITGVSIACGIVLMVALIVGGFASSVAQRNDAPTDCSTKVEAVVSDDSIDGAAQQNAMARQLYAVLHAQGIPDVNIAGVLGNFSCESGIDPTGIETIVTEKYNVNGPRKQAAMANWDSFTTGTVFPAYAKAGKRINQSAYKASDGKYYPGISLGQWTGGNAMKMIGIAEQVNGGQWWSMDFALAYLVAKRPPTGSRYFGNSLADWKEPESSPEAAAHAFAKEWEGNTNIASNRMSSASAWYAEIVNWEGDTTYANSVLALAQQLGSVSDAEVQSKASKDCRKTLTYDNTSIATAAVSFAYPHHGDGLGNNGTELYQRVNRNVTDGAIFQSCDYCVCSAVRWSGSDDDYPYTLTYQQPYLATSTKWEEVASGSAISTDNLLPGDVFTCDSHTWLYVGNELIVQIHGADISPKTANIVAASHNTYSPQVADGVTYYITNGHGVDPDSGKTYTQWRLIKPDNSMKYKGAGGTDYGKNL